METEIQLKRIGILGGSFDPIHLGHINIAKSAYEEFVLDEVWFIPAGHSPNKDETAMTPALQRAEMVSLAIREYPFFKLSSIELEAKETTYTYLTLTWLKERYPNVQFYFIMGADSLDYFETWKHPELICQKAVILVAVRDDMDVEQIRRKIEALGGLFQAEIYPVYGGKTDISSTVLREAIRNGQKPPDMLPQKVEDYIYRHHLYGKL